MVLVSCLSLHTFKNHFLRVRIANMRNEKERMYRIKLPRAKSLPHHMHCLWTKWYEVRESVVKEKDLVFIGMAGQIEPGLYFN